MSSPFRRARVEHPVVRGAVHDVRTLSACVAIVFLSFGVTHGRVRLYIETQQLALGAEDVSIPVLIDTDEQLEAWQLSMFVDAETVRLEEIIIEDDFNQAPLFGGGVIDAEEGHALGGGIAIIVPGERLVAARLVLDVIAAEPALSTIEFRDRPASFLPPTVRPGATNKFVRATDGTDVDDLVLENGQLILGDLVGVGPFARGDVDANRSLQLTDAISIFNFLFLGGRAPGCRAAADTDGDALINLTDGVYLLNFLFLGGTAPPAPHPACALSNSAGDRTLGCEVSQCP